MEKITTLKEFLQENKESGIEAIAQYIEEHIRASWQGVFQENHDRLLEVYNKAGDPAYGTYLNFLLLPMNKQLKDAGLRPEPRLPGDLDISREWGNIEERQRWMWSTIHTEKGESLGTIVTIVYHDHTQFRIPRQPQIIALNETHKEDIVAALSHRSSDFKHAREFAIEVEEYLKNQQSNS
ncbi:DUF6022 family protein [Desmospora activa]|uniref:Uncharacterized protein n=1 Tax=Desmospora activa DSM 45169 TaxID=1121389 RepID=A0A2T4ZBH1_9BACL|nr:DUF6022 family protein [Desmospora activa]PTM59250.1 hypothetical protein C8J48_1855 [Desmospora activa DSM 45169]